MANKHPHPVRSGIIATVAGGIILSAIPPLRNFFFESMSWAWSGVIGVWAALLSPYSVLGWALLIIGLFALTGLAVGLMWLLVVLRPQNEPAYRKYTEDMIDGAKWRWSWDDNEISNLWCFCPRCDAQLVPAEGWDETDFICERCPHSVSDLHDQSHGRVVATMNGGRYDSVNAVKREILRRIRTGEIVHSNS